jgi:hypothetical protein
VEAWRASRVRPSPPCRFEFFCFYFIFRKIITNTPLTARFQKIDPPHGVVVVGAKIKRLGASLIGAKLLAHVDVDAELEVM